MHIGGCFVISAPSGTGKTTIVRQLVGMLPRLVHSISTTTRPQRPSEQDGRDYHFVDDATFDRMVRDGAFVEWAPVHGARYGTPRAPLDHWRQAGTDIILDLDVQGARALRRAIPATVAIFVMPPSREALMERLRGRGTEDAAALQRRLEEADREMAAKSEYHHVVINDTIDAVCREIAQIIRTHRSAHHV